MGIKPMIFWSESGALPLSYIPTLDAVIGITYEALLGGSVQAQEGGREGDT